MTPTQLRAFSAVVRHGSVKEAAAELGVSESAVSIHVAQLRKELEDLLFTRTAAGIAFTPGGLRLASRATEMLGLQDRTIREVSQAGSGRRLLRVACSSLFAEHAAPGLIEIFAARANDLDVELSVRPMRHVGPLLASRAIDVAIGPRPSRLPESVAQKPFLNYRIVAVVAPGHPLASMHVGPAQLREQAWLLGPSATEDEGAIPDLVRQLDLPERNQQIFQSHSAALEEARRGNGVA
ncbi:MAG: LysR family transcriptional regulator, partial [Actinomycetota bacterium]|nr:LysR family transcriptional regulator [Actinomycetota bacterium]